MTTEVSSLECIARKDADDVDNLTRRDSSLYDVLDTSDLEKSRQQSGFASDDEITSSNGSVVNSYEDAVTSVELGDRDSGVDEEEMIDVESC